MKTVLKSLLLLILVVSLLAYWFLSPEEPPTQRVFVNGQVLTMDADNSVAQAIALRGDRIEAVGGDEDIRALIEAGAIVTDLEGKTLLPGIIDAHGHFPGSGLYTLFADLNSPPIGDVHNIADIQDRLRELLPGKGGEEWIAGWSYDDTLIAEKRHPTRHPGKIVKIG